MEDWPKMVFDVAVTTTRKYAETIRKEGEQVREKEEREKRLKEWESENKQVMQTYVYNEQHGIFFVSTIYRKAYEMWFYETLVWKMVNQITRGEWLYQASGLNKHWEICKALYDNGEWNGETR